jgi:SAM-dependent methyltransferase
MAKVEFDGYADTYYEDHKKNVEITGEAPEYFAEYKIADLAQHLSATRASCSRITDFGSGIGYSLPYFRKYFPGANLSCVDVSARSLQLAQDRFPGNETYLLIEGENIPIEDASQDVVFSACVFHHIPHEDHQQWLKELLRITRPGGVLAIYEHNSLNPLTVRAINTCSLDRNARLIKAWNLRQACLAAGWSSARIDYRLFFPRSLAFLRPLEKRLGWLCIGAQYRLLAMR